MDVVEWAVIAVGPDRMLGWCDGKCSASQWQQARSTMAGQPHPSRRSSSGDFSQLPQCSLFSVFESWVCV